MDFIANAFGFFHWVGISHYFNLLFIGFLIRSGIEILSAHPKLYWNEGCRPGTEWARFTRKEMPSDRIWTGADEEESFSSWIALPGRRQLGMGRHWHFFCAIFWIINGFTYVTLLFFSGEWRRLIPTSWSIFPQAARTAWTYLHLHLPPHGNPYNALQQITYAAVVFLLAPLILITGTGMSPAISARFPGYLKMLGGRQSARSLHFLALIAVCAFTFGHVTLVVIDDFPRNMAWIIHGKRTRETLSIFIACVGLVIAVLLHIWATRWSLGSPRQVQRVLGAALRPVRKTLLHGLTSRQHYSRADISPFFRVNGYPPITLSYEELAKSDFENWSLEVRGLVANPLRLSLGDLRAMPSRTQITKHHCIQGWSGVAEWTGVPVQEILLRCQPLAKAKYAVFFAFDEPHHPGKPYYETIDLGLASQQQTILAYAMNGRPLPIEHGAPCRLRVESQLGFKMVKYLRSLELVDDFSTIGQGQGGYREDVQFYDPEAGI